MASPAVSRPKRAHIPSKLMRESLLDKQAMASGAVDEQNTRLVASLLAKHKGIALNKDHFLDLPLWLEAGMIPITTGMPPYHYWEPPNDNPDRMPTHGEDLGMFMMGEVLGGRSVIYIKDEDGLYTEDPKKNPKARLIPAIEAHELLAMDMPELILEKSVVETMVNSRHMKQVQIVNGLKPEMESRALNGE